MFLESRILNVLWLAVLVGTALANVSNAVAADDEARYEATMEEEKLLLLTEINESDFNSKEANLPDFDNVMGVGDFLLLSGVKIDDASLTGQKRLAMQVISPDLTVFRVFVAKPQSFNIAKALVRELVYEFGASGSLEFVVSRFCRLKLEGDNYSLARDGSSFTGLARLSIARGIYISVDNRVIVQPLASPLNREVLIAQKDNLIDDLIALFDGEVSVTDERKAYYQALKSRYNEALNRTPVKSVPDNVPKYGLLLTAIPDLDHEGVGVSLEKNRTDKIIANRPYLVSRADGKTIPLVKIANPEKVSTEDAKPELFESDAEGIYDIQFQVTAQGKRHGGRTVTLRSDGQYQLVLRRSGKQTLRVLFVNERGEVIEYGEVEVEVVGRE